MSVTELPKLLTAREVAAVLRVTPERVQQLAREGRIPAIRIGERGGYRFRIEDVERTIAGGEVKSP
jgi:excisionase family DNA binding protein